VTEGVERDSRANDLTEAKAVARDYPWVTDQGSPRENHVTEPLLDTEEREAIDLLGRLGFECISYDNANLTFSRKGNDRLRLSPASRRSFPRAHVRTLLGQLGDTIDEHPAITGLMVPSRGYVELIFSRLEPTIAKRAFRLECNELDCMHREPANAMPSLPYHWPPEEGGEAVKRVHLSGWDGRPCVEISNASPLAMLLYGHMSESGRVRLAYPRVPLLMTLKIACSPTSDRGQLGRESENTARSLIYELNVRNGLILELAAPPAGPETLARRSPEVSGRVCYPRTRLQPEVALLFGFASQASSDPPQAFLSYYQALEYFIPTAIMQSAIKKMRQELRDPSFDGASDASLLRLVEAARGSIAAAEPHQLRTVINEYVRTSRLEEFFRRGWGGYFSPRGPIKGVPQISLNDKNQSLQDQVAERVYRIRNRIVHAKNDPRLGNARVLLPRSSESNALTPDVLLVRLLATEAISVG
jgi:hypothetical protein